MKMPYLLDTNVLIALLRNQALGHFIQASYSLFGTGTPPWVSFVSKGEIRAFARRNGWGLPRRQAMDQLFLQVVVVRIEQDAILDAYEEIDWASSRHPSGAINMGKNDLWIAATARALGATLLTTDKDFDHLHPALLQRVYIDPASALPAPPPP
jgi:predicted nucleic acid-binding protein